MNKRSKKWLQALLDPVSPAVSSRFKHNVICQLYCHKKFQMLSFFSDLLLSGDLILMFLVSTVEALSSSLFYIILNILLEKMSFYFELKRKCKNSASLASFGACFYPWAIMSSGDRICRLSPPGSSAHTKCWQKDRRTLGSTTEEEGFPLTGSQVLI